jgi:hypothetical protein
MPSKPKTRCEGLNKPLPDAGRGFVSFFLNRRRRKRVASRWISLLPLLLTFPVFALVMPGCAVPMPGRAPIVAKWDRFEQTFKSRVEYENPAQEAELRVVFTSPSGESRLVYGFWDGGRTWRVRFAPNEVGRWIYSTSCSDISNAGLHDQSGSFNCTAPSGRTAFKRHGPVQVSRDRRHLAHEDGTPFFWLADTAWNGALKSTPSEWDFYIKERKRQRFTAVQWVATQWRAAPDGDREGRPAFTGRERIAIDPRFFQRMDERVEALNRAGLLNVPVLLWAIGGGSHPEVNPGFSLPEDQAILLARYMVARWGGNDVVWILPGDGDYRGPRAERWKRIGRAVFGEEPHAPVMLHPGGMHWVLDEFAAEEWVDIHGYQSGHGDDERTLRWIVSGPPSTDWRREPARPFLNLEPPYEHHIAYQSQTRISPHTVRRAVYWSLLVAPTAGVSYGGHGVWGWDDGTKPPVDHPRTGVPLPLKRAIVMPGAEQMAHLARFFTNLEFWNLRPSPEVLAAQPGEESAQRWITAAKSISGDLLVVYLPDNPQVEIFQHYLPPEVSASWFNPRSGEIASVVGNVRNRIVYFATPGAGDWLLLVRVSEEMGAAAATATN